MLCFLPAANAFQKNSVAVMVNEEVITLFDLRQEVLLSRVYKGEGWDRPVTDAELRGILNDTVEKWLVDQDAVRFSIVEITEKKRFEELESFKKRFPTQSDYFRFLSTGEFSEETLLRLLTREFQRREFMKIKMGSFHMEPTDEEIQSYFWQQAVKYRGKQLSAVRGEIIRELQQLQEQRAMRRWIIDLRARSTISYVLK